MKSIVKFAAATAAGLLLTTAAYADTLNIVSEFNQGGNPQHLSSSTSSNAFGPGGKKISFKALGKTCTLNSSAVPYGSGAGKGCNYTVTINVSNESMTLASNGNGCTTSAQFSSSCQ